MIHQVTWKERFHNEQHMLEVVKNCPEYYSKYEIVENPSAGYEILVIDEIDCDCSEAVSLGITKRPVVAGISHIKHEDNAVCKTKADMKDGLETKHQDRIFKAGGQAKLDAYLASK